MFPTLEKSTAKLKETDVILHPNIENIIDSFFQANGDNSVLIEHLSNGFSGYLHKIDILCQIMSKYDSNFVKLFEKSLEIMIFQSFRPAAFDELVVSVKSIPQWVIMMCNHEKYAPIITKLYSLFPKSQNQ